jgi:hypothetical protein
MKMDNKTLYRMVEELRQQCRFALLGFQSIRSTLNTNDPERVFLQVHAFLGHAVSVSRLLWPNRAESGARGERLRQELKAPADSLLRLTGFREQVDRFDEAYEDWLLGLEDRSYMDMNLMPVGTVQGFKADSFQRSLDTETLRLFLRGTPCDLRKVNDEIRGLEAAAQQWLRTHNPW